MFKDLTVVTDKICMNNFDGTILPAPASLNRKMLLAFLPLVLLLAAALIANLGVSVIKDAKAANTVTVSASISSDAAITNTCGTGGTDGTLAFGSIAASTPFSSNCPIIFGSSNSTANLQIITADAFIWGGFTAPGAVCKAPAAKEMGLRADSGSTATRVAPFNCAAGEVRNAPTGAAATICSAASVGLRCDLTIAGNTGTVGSGPRSAIITTSLA